uniref:Uncharacterized protein n=1 Tax=Oryza barthii TaxID=65489 RepID=A0A0D3GVR4_9ORYZ
MADVSRACPALPPDAGYSSAQGHNVPSARRQSRRCWAAAHLFHRQPTTKLFLSSLDRLAG